MNKLHLQCIAAEGFALCNKPNMLPRSQHLCLCWICNRSDGPAVKSSTILRIIASNCVEKLHPKAVPCRHVIPSASAFEESAFLHAVACNAFARQTACIVCSFDLNLGVTNRGTQVACSQSLHYTIPVVLSCLSPQKEVSGNSNQSGCCDS